MCSFRFPYIASLMAANDGCLDLIPSLIFQLCCCDQRQWRAARREPPGRMRAAAGARAGSSSRTSCRWWGSLESGRLSSFWSHGEFDIAGTRSKLQYLIVSLFRIEGILIGNYHLSSTFLGAEMDHWCNTSNIQFLKDYEWTPEEKKNFSIPL